MVGGERAVQASDAILIVEDDPTILALIDQALREAGYSTLLAGTGQEALEILGTTLPALILLDLWLPVINGNVIADILKHDPTLCQIPIIVMGAGNVLLNHVAHLNADAMVAKPFDLDTLLATVARLLKRATPPDA